MGQKFSSFCGGVLELRDYFVFFCSSCMHAFDTNSSVDDAVDDTVVAQIPSIYYLFTCGTSTR